MKICVVFCLPQDTTSLKPFFLRHIRRDEEMLLSSQSLWAALDSHTQHSTTDNSTHPRMREGWSPERYVKCRRWKSFWAGNPWFLFFHRHPFSFQLTCDGHTHVAFHTQEANKYLQESPAALGRVSIQLSRNCVCALKNAWIETSTLLFLVSFEFIISLLCPANGMMMKLCESFANWNNWNNLWSPRTGRAGNPRGKGNWSSTWNKYTELLRLCYHK